MRWLPARSALVAAGLLLVAVAIAYCNALWGPFQFDDYNVIVDNPRVHSWPQWLADLPHGIRPLLKASYTLNWLAGPGPFGFHLFNVALHALNSVLVWRLGHAILTRFQPSLASPFSPAFAAALLFALHPVQTEAVTYISGRSVSLMSAFYLGSVLAYAAAARSGARYWRSTSLILFALAVATKEVALSLPLVLLLWELAGPAPAWREVVRRLWPHWALALAATALMLAYSNYGWLLDYSLSVRSIADNLLNQAHALAYLGVRLLLPQRLNIDPDLPLQQGLSSLLILEIAVLIGLLVLAVVCLRRRPVLGFGILWAFLLLAPTNSLLARLDLVNERQLYLADWGFFLAGCVAFAELRLVKAWWAVAGVLLLGGLTIQRNQDYRSEIALWEATAKLSPGKARPFNNLGVAYEYAGCPELALGAYAWAVRLNPGYLPARQNLQRRLAGLQGGGMNTPRCALPIKNGAE